MSSDAPDKWATARSTAAVAEWGSKGATAAAAAPTPAMRPLHLLGFSLGTVLNDCCASCWFNFLFVFLERVQGLSGSQVGAVFLTGQLSDAVATPLIGYLADRAQGLHVLGLGRRQIFYLLGVVIVSLSFVFVFAVCLPVRGGSAARGPLSSVQPGAAPALPFRPSPPAHPPLSPPPLPLAVRGLPWARGGHGRAHALLCCRCGRV